MTARPASLCDGFETVVGLEVHVQLKTRHKLFSPALVRIGQAPNIDLDAVDAGLPGALPVLNREAVRCAIRLGLALESTIARQSFFARKHYFYPDSPKGFQTSQADHPVVEGGVVVFVVDDATGAEHRIELVRAHLEEDAGKSLHTDTGTRLDFNRAGTALLEVVTTPTMHSGEEAMRFFRALRGIVMAIEICDGNLQEGSMRADANVSVRRPGEPLGTRVELKNINSPRFVCDAIEHEAARQRRLISRGDVVVQETRLWDADAQNSRSMRGKEDSPDYRYLPDPDLPALVITDDDIAAERATMPELPGARRRRYVEAYGLPPAQAAVLVDDADFARLFDAACLTATGHERAVANWLVNELAGVSETAVTVTSPQALARLVTLVETGELAGRDGKTLVRTMVDDALADAAAVDAIVDARGLRLARGQDAEDAVRAIIATVFATNPVQVEQVRSGKDKVKGFLVGQVLKAAGKGVDPKLAQRLVDDALAGS
jgi:aspartyl-tRNA(Asn)/glutamyl-tRNA(Gln) amidotransferase subunit B